jgi:hypothetical protein
MKKNRISQFWRVLLIIGLLIAVAAPLQAQTGYEVKDVKFSDTVTADQFVRVTKDLTVSWTAPSGVDPAPMNYYLKFSEQSTPLSGTELNDTTYDFAVVYPTDFKIIPYGFFDTYNSDKLRYLHIKTQYLDTGTGSNVYSDDVVSLAIRIDNVAPTGNLTLNPTSGSSRDVIVESMSFTEPIKYYWLSSADTFPGGTGATYAPPLFQGGTVTLQEGTVPGDVWIYAWFEDFAGNRTPAASASALYNYTASVAIRHIASVVGVGGSLVFDVGGAAYDWTINLSEPGVASIASGDSVTTKLNATSITVNGLKVGTFTVSAYPAGLTTGQLTSGVINVVQTTVSKTFTLSTTNKTNVNAIGFVLENTGITTAHELGLAVGNCDLVSRWDEATQKYSSHPMASEGYNNFPLVVGKAYFVSVTATHPFTLTGTLPSSKSVTLVTTAKTNVNAIGIPKSKETLTTAHQLGQNIGNVDLVSRWDVATQKYSSHPMASEGYNNFPIEWGYGYFVSVTQFAQWDW